MRSALPTARSYLPVFERSAVHGGSSKRIEQTFDSWNSCLLTTAHEMARPQLHSPAQENTERVRYFRHAGGVTLGKDRSEILPQRMLEERSLPSWTSTMGRPTSSNIVRILMPIQTADLRPIRWYGWTGRSEDTPAWVVRSATHRYVTVCSSPINGALSQNRWRIAVPGSSDGLKDAFDAVAFEPAFPGRRRRGRFFSRSCSPLRIHFFKV